MENLIDYSNYEIYEDGTIISKYFNRKLSGSKYNNGYYEVKLKLKDGSRVPFLWHRVVWYYFNGEIPENMQVNHIDEDKSNNAISNLNLMTPKDNSNWGTRNKRISKAKINLSSISKEVQQLDKNTKQIIAIYPSTREAHRNGFDSGAVSACCNNRYMREGNNIYKGYIWKYA